MVASNDSKRNPLQVEMNRFEPIAITRYDSPSILASCSEVSRKEAWSVALGYCGRSMANCTLNNLRVFRVLHIVAGIKAREVAGDTRYREADQRYLALARKWVLKHGG